MKTVIIGGGAAGLFAACLFAKYHADAVLVDRQPRVGRKLLSTGNGRCNLTNLNASLADYHGSEKHIRAALDGLSPKKAMAFFEELGVICAPDAAGRVYPVSNQAAGVLDALRFYAEEGGVDTLTEFEAVKIARRGRAYLIESADGQRLTADFVLLACGGPAAPKLGGGSGGHRLFKQLGHEIVPCLPGIAALKVAPEAVRALKGVRAQGRFYLMCEGEILRREDGEILFNEGVVSGIAAMQMAREVNLRLRRHLPCALKMNFFPDAEEDFIENRAKLLPRRSMEDFLSGVVPRRLGQVLVKQAGMPLSLRAMDLSPRQKMAIQEALCSWTLNIAGTQGFEQAQVSCGGARLRQFVPETLESTLCPNLFAAGEVLDVDGDCGGFNLHWAWASASLAAREILKRQGLGGA